MSYAEIIPFAFGKPLPGIRFSNAWGGAPRIWDALLTSFPPQKYKGGSLGSNPYRQILDLAAREEVPPLERAVMAFTFDRFYVRSSNFARLAADFRSFVQRYPAEEGQIDHLPAWARLLDEGGGVEAFGLRVSSSGPNLWYRPKICPHCGSETDENEPIRMTEGTEVYDWLESLKER